MTAAGIRFCCRSRSACYSTDFNELTDESLSLFKECGVWLVDALRRKPHPTHPHLAQTPEWVGKVRPVRAVLTHMDQSMAYETLSGELPPDVVPGYAGMGVGSEENKSELQS